MAEMTEWDWELKRSIDSCRNNASLEQRFGSRLIEIKIEQSLAQIDRMLDKMNFTEDQEVKTKCLKSLNREQTKLIQYEYFIK